MKQEKAAPMPERHAILVLGTHRSGTSALTRMLHLQGAVLPKTLMPAQPDNPEGFFESLAVVRLNDQWLHRADRSWDDPRPFPLSWWHQRGQRLHYIDQAAQLLQREFPEGDWVALKDPRLCRLLPIWLDACRSVGLSASALLCCRNPLEVSASLAKRNGIDGQRAQLLWLGDMLEAEKGTRALPRALVQFDSLLVDWRHALSDAYDALGLDALELSGGSADAIDTILSPNKRHHKATTDELLQDERISPLLKEAWTLFRTRPLPSAEAFDRLRGRLTDAWSTIAPQGKLMASAIVTSPPNPASSAAADSETDEAKPVTPHRHIVLHYHLFKNAGTSLDHILKQNFGPGWREHEGPAVGWRATGVGEYLLDHPEIVVLSSHTALLPPPILPGTSVYPVIFLRHPIDRIRSIYDFEVKQIADTVGARMAKQTDLAGYIRWRLQRKGDRAIRNFQAYRLSFAVPEQAEGTQRTEEEPALKALQTLPFIGVVEEFDKSLATLQQWLKPIFPHIEFKPTKANVTQKGHLSLDERLQGFHDEIGTELYTNIQDANALDLKLWESANTHR